VGGEGVTYTATRTETYRSNGSALEPNEADDDPHRLARSYRDKHCIHDGCLTLRFWRDEWHKWNGSAYRVVPVAELKADLATHIKKDLDRRNLERLAVWDGKGRRPQSCRLTGALTSDVAHALASLTILPSGVQQPAWIDEDGHPPGEILAARNGLAHLPTLFADPTAGVFAHSPKFFSPIALDYDFCRRTETPTAWLEFLTQLWPGDQESIDTLQDFMGYLLTPDTRHHKILTLVGPKRSGKGTIARINRKLVGHDNVVGPTLTSLGTNFGLQPLLGKSVAIISDARLGGRTDVAAVVERLLSISGEDAQTIDRKYLPAVTTKLGTRFIILTNELPRLADSSGALASRMILLRLTQSWYGMEDTSLTDRLVAEIPGILLWAMAGWCRLRERGRFLQPKSGKELLETLEDLSSPIGAFVRERCVVGPGHSVKVEDLFSRWKQWCELKGRQPGVEQVFGRDLHAFVPTLSNTQPRAGQTRYRAYEGIGLR
jgi:putative DNA primase/helicase